MVNATARVPRTPDASSATSTRQGLDPSHIRPQCHLTSPMCLVESNPLKRSALSVGHVDSGANSKKTVQRVTRTNAPTISVFVRVSVGSSAHARKRSFGLSTRRQTCSQKSQVGRCTRHLPNKNKSLGAEHHKCSRCRHFVQRGSSGYSKIDSNSAKNSLKRH